MSQEQPQRRKTIGEALEDAAKAVGDSPVDQCDAAAIEAAEMRASGITFLNPSGLPASAQAAATSNSESTSDDNKIKLSHVLADASKKLTVDKVVTMEDAEEVIMAEANNNPREEVKPVGVAMAVATAAKENESTWPNQVNALVQIGLL